MPAKVANPRNQSGRILAPQKQYTSTNETSFSDQDQLSPHFFVRNALGGTRKGGTQNTVRLDQRKALQSR
jgi:hypothetical protein